MTNTHTLLKKIEVISELEGIPVVDIMDWDDKKINAEYFILMEDKENL